ncbi:hypothetical protein [Shinella zoogloeoides]|uniref:hypothetical protein n=1 Tax=Shinella zoogloeoides TaxID=352475 RepID=UPI00299ED486|nr:hypothetical protein [Shinella zoogloeoides]WPE19982.1 hypothetical protein ShzoTeo12_11620 [Shinella zoogloeoides]
MALKGPHRTGCPEDRLLRCEEDLEAEFHELLRRAALAGWSESEACTAIASLADHRILAADANNRMMSEIASRRPSGIVIRAPRR